MDPVVRARIKTQRKLAGEGYGPLYDSIRAILIAHNPAHLDVTRGDARDDYGLPVGTLIPQLETADQARLRDILCVEMEHWYRHVAGPPERYQVIADEIWRVWTAFRRMST